MAKLLVWLFFKHEEKNKYGTIFFVSVSFWFFLYIICSKKEKEKRKKKKEYPHINESCFNCKYIWYFIFITNKLLNLSWNLIKYKTNIFNRNSNPVSSSISIFINTAQKMKFSNKDFFSKRDQIRRELPDLLDIR